MLFLSKPPHRIRLARAPRLCAGLLLASVCLSMPTSVLAVDAAAAEMLARQNGCFKCHSIDKKKDGPPYREVAAKYRGKAGAEAKLYHHVTSGEKAKFPDGHEEDHKIIKTTDATEIKNLIGWILSL